MKPSIGIKILTLWMALLWQSYPALNNGLALSPPLGYKCNTALKTEDDIKKLTDILVNEGYKTTGYQYVILENWNYGKRTAEGKLEISTQQYPSGMKSLADYVHSKDMKFGLTMQYSALSKRNQTYTQDEMKKDAATLAEWGVDYVELTMITAPRDQFSTLFQDLLAFGKYLNETGRPIVYSCKWLKEFQNETAIDYEAISSHCNVWTRPLLSNISADLTSHRPYIAPGSWREIHDLPTNHLTYENHEHGKMLMAIWVVFASPILMTFEIPTEKDYVDFRSSTQRQPESKAILQNKEIIKIHQDELATSGQLLQWDGNIEIVARPVTPIIKGMKSLAICFINHGHTAVSYGTSINSLKLDLNYGYSFQDLYSAPGDTSASSVLYPNRLLEMEIPSGGVKFFKVSPLSNK